MTRGARPSRNDEATRVIDSRESEGAIRRRRQCVACTKRFTTYERWERPELRVVKRDGRVEDFDRDKLEMGILRACEKRPIGREQIGAVLDAIEEELRSRESSDVPTTEIGAIVLEQLKGLDPVAYIRFASVYKSFEEPAQFERELKHLKQTSLDNGAPVEPAPKRKALGLPAKAAVGVGPCDVPQRRRRLRGEENRKQPARQG